MTRLDLDAKARKSTSGDVAHRLLEQIAVLALVFLGISIWICVFAEALGAVMKSLVFVSVAAIE